MKLTQIFEGRSVAGFQEADAQEYAWYIDKDAQIVGIKKDSLTDSERELLNTFYDVINPQAKKGRAQLKWWSFLMDGVDTLPPTRTPATPVRFTFFYHDDFDPELKDAFEALLSDFNQDIILLHLEDYYSVLIESRPELPLEEDNSTSDFLLAAKDDFSPQLVFYETRKYQLELQLASRFQDEFKLFKSFKDHKKSQITVVDLFLNYLMSSDVVGKHPIFGSWFERVLLLDTDLLKVVKFYLENGANVSVVSKEMHMHRNTVANKLERFKEETGLDIKAFDQAVIAYLLIRLKRNL